MYKLRPRNVEVPTALMFLHPDAIVIPVPATLRYNRKDPYTVGLWIFDDDPTDEQKAKHWCLERKMLALGMYRPTGSGMVRVWPRGSSGGECVGLSLASPDKAAVFGIARDTLLRFLRLTYFQVPSGQESNHMDIDALVEMLMA